MRKIALVPALAAAFALAPFVSALADDDAVPAEAESASRAAFEPAWLALCDDLNIPGAPGKIFSALSDLVKTELTKSDA